MRFKLELCLKFTNLVNIGPTSRYGALISINFSPFPAYRCDFYFQGYFKPHPDRAQELRKIGKGAEGWLKRVWPSLTVIKATFGCIYAAPVPKVCSIWSTFISRSRDHPCFELKHHFGPTVLLDSMWYGATECLVAVAYGRNDHNLYRLEANGHIEFLEEGDPANLFQPVRDLLNFLTVTF